MQQHHNEAPVLSFTKIITPAGYTHSITIREGASKDDIKTQLTNINRLDAAFHQMNWQPAETRHRHQSHSGPAPAAAATVTSSGSQPPAAASNGSNGQVKEINIFDCQSLACTSEGGKQYWKISDAGHRWKYPVIIYPEVLAKYFNPDSLDPDTTYTLTSWKAVYEQNDKGYPKKVIALNPPGETTPAPQPEPQQIQAAAPPATAETLQHSDPERYEAGLAAANNERQPVAATAADEIPF